MQFFFTAKGFPIDEFNRLALDRVKSISALSAHSAVKGLSRRGIEWSMKKSCISENISPVSKSRHSKQEARNLGLILNSLEVFNFYNSVSDF